MGDDSLYGKPTVVQSDENERCLIAVESVRSVSLTEPTEDGFRLAVQCDETGLEKPMAELGEEALTISVSVPDSWYRFTVVQGAGYGPRTTSRTYEVREEDGKRFSQFHVRPNIVPAVVTQLSYRVGTGPAYAGPIAPDSSSPRVEALCGDGKTQWLSVDAGRYYELTLPRPDDVSVGTRWEGMDAKHSPLAPMFRSRLIVKLDDLGDWSFDGFRLFCQTAEAHSGKADVGINPGICGPEVWEWLRTQDRKQFDLWNHSWDHGHQGGLKYRGLPYDVQYYHHELGQDKVKRELGYTMTVYGYPGTRPFPDAGDADWIGDWDVVTYTAARNHPDLRVVFNACSWQSDNGLNRINSDGMLTLNDVSEFEWGLWEQDPNRADERLAKLYPDENPVRPSAKGNGGELIWRLHHPYLRSETGDRFDVMFAQFHPYREYMGDEEQQAFAVLYDHVNQSDTWRCATASETYRWFRDRDLIAVEKTAPDRYRLEAQRLHFSHLLELAIPRGTRVEANAYHVYSFDADDSALAARMP